MTKRSLKKGKHVSRCKVIGPLLVGLGMVCSGLAIGAERGTVVYVEQARLESVRQVQNVVGQLVARQAGYVATRIEGPVGAIYVEVGDEVKKGQKIAALDAEILQIQVTLSQARVAEAQANLSIRRSALARVRQEKNRLQKLKNSAATSLAQFEDAVQRELTATARKKEARIRVTTAQSELALAETNLRYALVTAPYDGVVAERLTETGEYVKKGQALARLVSNRQLELEADVSQSQAAALAVATIVSFRIEGGALHEARVRAVVPEEDPRTRTRRVRFSIPLELTASALATNQSVMLALPVGPTQTAVTVHKDALVHKGGKVLVFVIRNNKAFPQPVTLGISAGSRIAITQGLKGGEIVVIRGNERITPGRVVKIAKPSS